jgi:hypothetical protein
MLNRRAMERLKEKLTHMLVLEKAMKEPFFRGREVGKWHIDFGGLAKPRTKVSQLFCWKLKANERRRSGEHTKQGTNKFGRRERGSGQQRCDGNGIVGTVGQTAESPVGKFPNAFGTASAHLKIFGRPNLHQARRLDWLGFRWQQDQTP